MVAALCKWACNGSADRHLAAAAAAAAIPRWSGGVRGEPVIIRTISDGWRLSGASVAWVRTRAPAASEGQATAYSRPSLRQARALPAAVAATGLSRCEKRNNGGLQLRATLCLWSTLADSTTDLACTGLVQIPCSERARKMTALHTQPATRSAPRPSDTARFCAETLFFEASSTQGSFGLVSWDLTRLKTTINMPNHQKHMVRFEGAKKSLSNYRRKNCRKLNKIKHLWGRKVTPTICQQTKTHKHSAWPVSSDFRVTQRPCSNCPPNVRTTSSTWRHSSHCDNC